MQTLKIEDYGFIPMSTIELNETVGGHDGKSYEVGHAIGEVIQVVGAVLSIRGGIKSLIKFLS